MSRACSVLLILLFSSCGAKQTLKAPAMKETLVVVSPVSAITTFQTSATTASSLRDNEGRLLLSAGMFKKVTQFCTDATFVVNQNPTGWCPYIQSMYQGLMQNSDNMMTTTNLFFSRFEESMSGNKCVLR